MEIKDSGERRQFESGAVRDIQKGKGRCDLMPLDIIAHLYDGNKDIYGVFSRLEQFKRTGDPIYLRLAFEIYIRQCGKGMSDQLLDVALQFEDGAVKYGENNWQKGIPVNCYIDSATRHYLKVLRGDTDEPHSRAFMWNLLCCMWTCENMPELNTYKKEDINEGNTNSADRETD